jgi:hypothetical protein
MNVKMKNTNGYVNIILLLILLTQISLSTTAKSIAFSRCPAKKLASISGKSNQLEELMTK